MLLRELVLVNFRNYVRLALTPGDPITVLVGNNGQGKSNVLEAIYFLATTRSPRTSNDRELVHWRARRDVIPFARLEARIDRQDVDVHVEILIRAENDATAQKPDTNGTVPAIRPVTKQIKVNGLPTRAVELIGQVNVVLFTPDDVALVAGAPSVRRRYLDITLSQVSPQYLRTLQRYNRVLVQRNHLLRQLRDRRQPRNQLDFWNDELVKVGAFVVACRAETITRLNRDLAPLYRELGGSQSDLQLTYQPTSHDPAALAAAPLDQLPDPAALAADRAALARLYTAKIQELLPREIEQGVTLVGPHRDDFGFVVDGVDLHDYGSRGQQRLAVLALKLSEGSFMQGETGESPILLLDDILSELDPTRRAFVLAQAGRAGQTIITTTDLNDFPPSFLRHGAAFRVERGTLASLDSPDPREGLDPHDGPAASWIDEQRGGAGAAPPLRRVAERPAESSAELPVGQPSEARTGSA